MRRLRLWPSIKCKSDVLRRDYYTFERKNESQMAMRSDIGYTVVDLVLLKHILKCSV